MSSPSPADRLRNEDGFTLVEAIVAGALLVLAMTATFSVLSATGRASADQRQRAQSYAIAQADQSRMRSLRISELLSLNQTRTVVQGGATYTVTSTGQFVSDATGTVSCEAGTASADYINITSSVDWASGRGHPPTVIKSVVAAPNGSISTDRGTLAVAVLNGQSEPVAGIPLSGSGAGTFSGTTGDNGCALFPNLPEGNYTLTPSTATGVVDRDGDPPGPMTVSVVGQSTNTVALQYDTPGTVDVTFTTRVSGSVTPVAGDSVVVFNTGMTEAATFGTVGTRVATLSATPLFPFASPDTVYAGSCTDNNPNPLDEEFPPAAPAMADVTITPGGTATAEIQLPALRVAVQRGVTVINNARVTVTDSNCLVGGVAPKRTYINRTTGLEPVPSGGLGVNPGLPYGTYDICAGNSTRHNFLNDVPVQTTATDTSVLVDTGNGTGFSTGPCP